jgi:hypothetical protein
MKADSTKALKSAIATGIKELSGGRFQTYSDANIMELADDVSRLGRIRLTALCQKDAAKVHGKQK